MQNVTEGQSAENKSQWKAQTQMEYRYHNTYQRPRDHWGRGWKKIVGAKDQGGTEGNGAF